MYVSFSQAAVPIAQIPHQKACWVLTSNSQFILNPIDFFFYLIICFLVVVFRVETWKHYLLGLIFTWERLVQVWSKNRKGGKFSHLLC